MWIGVAWWKISIWLMGIAGVACLVGSFFIVDEGQAPLLLTAAGLLAGAVISYLIYRG